MGNSEILAKEALMGAKSEGAQVELIRLTDYKIEPCHGCAYCINEKKPCNINDDTNQVYQKMIESDGLILVAPCYILSTTAIVKLLIDRGLYYSYQDKLAGKIGAIIAPAAGGPGWTLGCLPIMRIFFNFQGIFIIDQFIPICQSPGEILLDEASLSKTHQVGKKMVQFLKGGHAEYMGEKGICPFCHLNYLRILEDRKRVECPICGVSGQLSMDGEKIQVQFIGKSRWSPEERHRHFKEGIVPAKDIFLKKKEEIKRRGEKYQNYLRR